MHECFLAPALYPVGVFSKTVCGVKSHWVMDKKMLICNLPPFLTPHMRRTQEKIVAPYHCHIQREGLSEKISKETEMCIKVCILCWMENKRRVYSGVYRCLKLV